MNGEQEPAPEPTTKFQLIFEASGAVGKGEGPDALDVPAQPDQEESES